MIPVFLSKIVVRVEGKDIQISLFLQATRSISWSFSNSCLALSGLVWTAEAISHGNIEIPFRVPKKKPDDLLAGFGFDQQSSIFPFLA